MNMLLQSLLRVRPSKILVVGDVMLDRYTVGDAERVSPEAPVIVLRANRHEVRLGGAASVAMLLRALEMETHLAGVIGDDSDGRVIHKLCSEEGIDAGLVTLDPSRETTVKHRFFGSSMGRVENAVLRVDYEDTHTISAFISDRIRDAVSPLVEYCGAVVISDYAKGVCTEALVSAISHLAHHCGVPVLIDPGRGVDVTRYRGATIIKANRTEAQVATGITINSVEDAIAAGRMWCDIGDHQHAVITLDRDGIAVVTRDGSSQHYPTNVRSVCDITGAGDSVISALAACVANNVAIEDAVQLANIAAGIQVEQVGVVPITLCKLTQEVIRRTNLRSTKRVDLDTITALVDLYRTIGKRVVVTNGCFDLLHVGHLACLQEAARQGDVLIVAINSDRGIQKLKGAGRPIVNQHDRASMLCNLPFVDHVLIFDDATPHLLLKAIRPDVLVKGGSTADVIGQEVVEAYGGRVHVTGLVEGVSTTGLVSHIRNSPSGH